MILSISIGSLQKLLGTVICVIKFVVKISEKIRKLDRIKHRSSSSNLNLLAKNMVNPLN